MDEANQPKRRWFHFHLSTAIVMMVAAGLWVRLQTMPTTECSTPQMIREEGVSETDERFCNSYFRTVTTSHYGLPWRLLWVKVTREESSRLGDSQSVNWGMDVLSLVLDVVCLLWGLNAVLAISEWLIRRRARRATASNTTA